jgi:TolA-binding protein
MRNFVWAVVAGLSVIGSSLSTRAQGIPEAQDYAFGHGLYKDGMYQQAYAELSKFVENYPNSLGRPEASFLVADCAFRLGKYDVIHKELSEQFSESRRLLPARRIFL